MITPPASSGAAPLSRAQGCLLGQLAGDALGSLVEFQTPEQIRRAYPDGVRDMADGGSWDTLAGQPTDDSEMALALARSLVREGGYYPAAARRAYEQWLDSGPFDCGGTVYRGLRGDPNPESQANGALMRVSPLGIYGARHAPRQVAQWAEQDAALTHPHPICGQVNALFALAVAHAVCSGPTPAGLYSRIVNWAEERQVQPALLDTIRGAASAPPADYTHLQGWVLIAFGNALWHLLYAPDLESGVVDTVGRGGDTDTNAAICGALLGAVYGREAVPVRWIETLQGCRPRAGEPGVHRPRPQCYWPVDALPLAEALVRG